MLNSPDEKNDALPSADECDSSPTEMAQLRIRIIALENLLIALLAQAPESQLLLAREMASYISPRAGHTPHPLTLRAADEMRSLLDRAAHFGASSSAELASAEASSAEASNAS